MISVLIVEDDPMVAEFNKRYLAQLDGFKLAGVAHSVKEALDYLEDVKIDLILLDVYMPNQNGLELMKHIRSSDHETDTILITAASDTEKIKAALRLGAIDYLIKPFEFERFSQALEKYKQKFYFLNANKNVRQEELDTSILFNDETRTAESVHTLPKGVSRSTLALILDAAKAKGNSPFSTDDLADELDISRVSIRKYLKFLADIDVLGESMTYGIGRPLFLYTLKKENEHMIKKIIQ